LWPSTSLCFLAFRPTISMLKSTTTLHPKLFASSTSHASCASQVWCVDLITTQVGLFSFLCFGPCQPKPIVGPFEVWLFVNLGPSLAYFKVWLIVSPGPLSAHYGVWPIVGPFGSAFTSHLLPLLVARQPLSSLAASTIYEPFPTSTSTSASATAIIIV
jgi:hypothetical protein